MNGYELAALILGGIAVFGLAAYVIAGVIERKDAEGKPYDGPLEGP